MANDYDFKTLASNLLGEARTFVPSILPGGKMIGNEWTCADKYGQAGSSMKVNIQTGKWSDFAVGEAGHDLISLYAYVNDMNNGQAFRDLTGDQGRFEKTKTKPVKSLPQKPLSLGPNIVKPPLGATKKFPSSSTVYKYTDIDGELMFYVERIDKVDGSKVMRPYSYLKDGHWTPKVWPTDRPLFNLARLKDSNKPVLIVEGEKCIKPAEQLSNYAYDVVTSQGGSNAWKKTDWTPLKGRSILIWPDADPAGEKYANSVADHLYKMGVKEIKLLKVNDLPKGYDAADISMPHSEFLTWARSRVYVYEPKPVSDLVVPDYMNEVPPDIQEPFYPSVEEVEGAEQVVKPPSKLQVLWSKLGLALSKEGFPKTSTSNIYKIIEQHKKLKGKVWLDTFHNKELTTYDCKEPREFRDADYVKIQVFIQDKVGIHGCPKTNVIDAITLYAHSNKRSEPKEWLESLEWDGTARVTKFLSDYLNTDDDLYHQCVSKNFWVMMVARVMKPGCKADNMMIIEGKQGAFKSTALSVIGGPWYTESNENIKSKDFPLVMQGNLIVEIAELDSFNKSENNTVKKVVSTATDRFRSPYDRKPQNHPRQSILVGTTNDASYLRDVTGARRFWPVKAGKINIDKIKEDRSQLFAEAVMLYKMGEAWHEVPLELAEAMQESRREADIWQSDIESWLINNGRTRVTVPMIAWCALQIPIERRDRRTSIRISGCLRVLGFEAGSTSTLSIGAGPDKTRYTGKVYKREEPLTIN